MSQDPNPLFDTQERLELSFKVDIEDKELINTRADTKITLRGWDGVSYNQLGETEPQHVDFHLEFKKTITVEFHFEQIQLFEISLEKSDLFTPTVPGKAEFKLSSIITNYVSGLEIDLVGEQGQVVGTCVVRYKRATGNGETEYKSEFGVFEVQDDLFLTNQENLENWTLVIFRPSNAYVSETHGANVPAEAWKTIATLKNTSTDNKLAFTELSILEVNLCRGMENTAFRAEIWNSGVPEAHETMAISYFSLYGNLVPKVPLSFFKDHESQNDPKGFLPVASFSKFHRYSILQFINYGLTLSLAASIDYTASNGNPSNKDSLHYLDPTGKMNQYQTALSRVFSILEAYDTDRMIPVMGFGGMAPDLGISSTSHNFPLTGDLGVKVKGTKGVLDLYEESLPKIRLAGPTFFAPTIQEVRKLVKPDFDRGSYSYTILLILTDGTINDVEETQRAIEGAALLPLSIIIVGVGEEDFTEMKILDRGEAGEGSGFEPKRDIVQFVSFRKYKNDVHGVAAAVLSEIPKQIGDFYGMVERGELRA